MKPREHLRLAQPVAPCLAASEAGDVAGDDHDGRRLSVFPPDDPAEFLADDHWAVYLSVIDEALARGIGFALGGGLATSFYTGAWRNSKDIDLYVVRRDAGALIDCTAAAGLHDLFDRQPYDRNWIYRAIDSSAGVIVDVIWALANGFGVVDELWITAGGRVEIRGRRLKLIAPEELLLSKVHVLQRERCDWPDLINLLYAIGPELHWPRVLASLDGDARLLASLLGLFAWLSPGRAALVPQWVWERLELPAPDPYAPLRDESRIARLDTRPWFSPIDFRSPRRPS